VKLRDIAIRPMGICAFVSRKRCLRARGICRLERSARGPVTFMPAGSVRQDLPRVYPHRQNAYLSEVKSRKSPDLPLEQRANDKRYVYALINQVMRPHGRNMGHLKNGEITAFNASCVRLICTDHISFCGVFDVQSIPLRGQSERDWKYCRFGETGS
jgi:hypothetical protein